MGVLTRLFGPRGTSAILAKERLQIILAHERAGRDAPEFLPLLQRDMLEVLRRYVDIRDDMIRVNLGKQGDTHTQTLEINVDFESAMANAARHEPLLGGRRATSFEPG
jgi:cell division topological specificity factor